MRFFRVHPAFQVLLALSIIAVIAGFLLTMNSASACDRAVGPQRETCGLTAAAQANGGLVVAIAGLVFILAGVGFQVGRAGPGGQAAQQPTFPTGLPLNAQQTQLSLPHAQQGGPAQAPMAPGQQQMPPQDFGPPRHWGQQAPDAGGAPGQPRQPGPAGQPAHPSPPGGQSGQAGQHGQPGQGGHAGSAGQSGQSGQQGQWGQPPA